jgi:phosphoglycerate dehydrogenase-like enzyme
MSGVFRIGVTRDFLDSEGRLTYRDIGLGLLRDEPRVEHAFFPEFRSPVPPAAIAETDAVLTLMPVWNAATFAEGAERLLIVARFGVGYDSCEVPVLTANNVLLTITPGAPDHPVAGGVLAMMLALSRRLLIKDRLVREGRWDERVRYQGTEIAGKTLGIIGYGGTGRELRRLVDPFEMRLLAYDPYVPDRVLAGHRVERAADLPTLFEQADYVSVHCLLNAETRGMIDRRLFARMKPTAYFLNAARGPIVNEADLVAALEEGRIAGAGLDVFEEEPPRPDHPLLRMENVVLAPHAIGWTDECFQAIGESAIRSILSVRRGEKPFGLVNPEVWERPAFREKLAAMRARL